MPRDWVPVCSARDVGREPARFKLPGGADVVIVRHGGRLLAMSNRCPHKDASLHRSGDIEDLGGSLGLCLRCPKHRGKFGGGLLVSFETGQCTTRGPCSKSDKVASWSVPVYEAKEEDGVVSVRRAGKHTASARRPEEQPTVVVEPASSARHAGERPQAALAAAAGDRAEERRLAARFSSISRVNHNSHIFTLQLADGDRSAFAREPAVMWHIWLHVGDVKREYTPLSSAAETAGTGAIRLLIKLYERGDMSEALAATKVGDRAEVSPPRVTLQLPALDAATPGVAFNLLAGGTGIAPCFQLLQRARAVGSSVRMLYSNWTSEDVLLASELEELAACWRGAAPGGELRPRLGDEPSFLYALVLTREEQRLPKQQRCAAATLCGRHIDAAMVREHLLVEGAAARTAATIVSGPSGFNEHCQELLRRALGGAEHGEIAVLEA